MGKLLSCLRPSSNGSQTGEGRSVPSGAGDGASRYCIEPSGKAHGLYVVIVLNQMNNHRICHFPLPYYSFHLHYDCFICIMAKANDTINAKNLTSPVLQLPALNKSEDILNTVIYGGSGATAICGGGDNAVHVVDFAHGNALPV
jgi:hypothetical protein